MKDEPVRLGRREQQIVDLLLQGCDNGEIAKQLNIAHRTVKAHFNRLFLRFGITSGIKRVKLATLLYRRQLCLETGATEHELPADANSKLSNSLPRDSRTGKSRTPSEPRNTSSKTIFVPSMTSSASGTGSNSHSGTRPARTNKRYTRDVLEAWEHSIMGLGEAMLPERSAAK